MPPVSEDFLKYFIAYCFKSLHLQFSTIKSYLCGIRFHYIKTGFNPFVNSDGNPFPAIVAMLQGIKKLQGRSKPSRLPITIDVLKIMCETLDKNLCVLSLYETALLRCVFTLAFYAFLRCSEFTATTPFDPNCSVTFSDVHVDHSKHHFTFNLKASKTDVTRQGVSIKVFRNNTSTCPVVALLKYLSIRDTHFKSKFQQPSDPLFLTEEGIPLSRNQFLQYLKTVLMSTGLDHSQFTGHSFRIGAATTAAKSRVEDHLIKTLGRWSSDCYQRYIHTPAESVRDAQILMSV